MEGAEGTHSSFFFFPRGDYLVGFSGVCCYCCCCCWVRGFVRLFPFFFFRRWKVEWIAWIELHCLRGGQVSKVHWSCTVLPRMRLGFGYRVAQHIEGRGHGC